MDNGICMDILKDRIRDRGYIDLITHGNSMLPTIKGNEKVNVSKCEEISIGDIIAYFFENNGRLDIVIHRVVLVRKDYVLAKGDNNNFIDPIRIPISSILGVVYKYEV